MKSTLLTFSLIFVSNVLFSQTASFEWVKTMGWWDTDGGAKIQVDSKGCLYTIGYFGGSVDFDPGAGTYYLNGDAYRNVFISKLDAQGNFLYAKAYKNYNGSVLRINSIGIDSSDNIYVSGVYDNVVDFNPDTSTVYNITANSGQETFITKLDSTGNFKWAKQFKTTAGYSLNTSIAIDIYNYLHITGTFYGKVDFDPGPDSSIVNSKNSDIYIAVLDKDGNLVWVKTIGGTKSDVGNFITVDKSRNSYIVGTFLDTIDFDPDTGKFIKIAKVSWRGDSYILKLDSSGAFVWVQIYKTAPLLGHATYRSIDIDTANNIYISGYFDGGVDFNPNSKKISYIKSNGSDDIFVTKLRSDGNFVWAKQWGGTGYEDGSSVVDKAGNVYNCGRFQKKVDFNPGIDSFILSSKGLNSIYISELNTDGEFQWAKSMGNSNVYISANNVAIDQLNNIYTTGSFRDTLDFNPDTGVYNVITHGNDDVFIHKMSQCLPTFSSSSGVGCDSLVFYGKSYYSTGIYYDTLANANGCDSIIKLNITIGKNKFSYSDNACGNYNFNGNILTTSGIYYDTLINSKGCDSIVTLSLTLNNTSFSYSENACNSYEFNGDTLATSGIFYDTLVNAKGCDSLVILNLTIVLTTFDTTVHSACNYFVYRGRQLISSGIYYDTLINSAGCDSIIVLYLTINKQTAKTYNITACDSFIFNSKILRSSGNYLDTLQTINGCDSIVFLTLNVNKSSAFSYNAFACVKYDFNGKTLRNSGMYIDTLTNAAGCDSIITLNLFLTPVNIAVSQNANTLSALAAGAHYQWLDCNRGFAPLLNDTNQIYTAKINGDYAVAITEISCTDTSVCYTVSNLGIHEDVYSFTVFPNPTNGKIRIQADKNLSNATVRLYTTAGQLVIQKVNLTGENFTLDIFERTAGIYVLEIIQDANVARLKVVKE